MENNIKNQMILKKYIRIAKFIADINGPDCEVLVHDLKNIKESIIFVANGHITGREVGGGITDYALSIITKDNYRTKDSVVNYIGRSNEGKITRSSTYYIKDDNEELIGLLCVNYDISKLLKMKNDIDYLINLNNDLQDDNILENFSNHKNDSVDKFLDDSIRRCILESDSDVPINEVENIKNPINIMYKLGIFNIKDSVNSVANLFNLSPQTIYRYIQKLGSM